MALTPAAPASRAAWRNGPQALLVACMALASLWIALTTLLAIINFAAREPIFDQWREYENFLELPFPQNVLQMANGHRPILPNLIRVAEVHWFAADQRLQISIGALAAFLCAGLLAWLAWREPGLSRLRRHAGVMLAIIGLLWLVNARRLLHGSEALHGYLPTLAAIAASWCMYRAARSGTLGPIAAASVACVLATFSFGLGLACFCSVLALGVLLRLPWRQLLLPLAVLIACGVSYVYLLPGNDGVREQLGVQPLTTAALVAEWIGAPWKMGWLKLDTETAPLLSWGALPEIVLAALARFVSGTLGIDNRLACFVLGLLGIALFAAFFVRAWRRNDATRLEIIALGSGVYALACGAITVLGRLQYLQTYPDQISADRYLTWPTLFWCALALLVLQRLPPLRSRVARACAAISIVALPVALSVIHEQQAIWGSIVYRNAERFAAAARSGVFDQVHFTGEDVGTARQLREIALLRDRNLAMFRDPAWQRIGTAWTGTLETDSELSAQARWLERVTDPTTPRPAARLEGWVAHGIATVDRFGELVLLDANGIIAGFANFSFVKPGAKSLLLRVPRKRGFDGYVRDYDAEQEYTLAVADFTTNRAIVLARLPTHGLQLPAPQTEPSPQASTGR
jgi:hypothetical protein